MNLTRNLAVVLLIAAARIAAARDRTHGCHRARSAPCRVAWVHSRCTSALSPGRGSRQRHLLHAVAATGSPRNIRGAGAPHFCLWRCAVYRVAARSRGATIALYLIAMLPVMSFAAGLARQLPFGAHLIWAWETPVVRFSVPAVLVLLTLAMFVKSPGLFDRLSRGLLLAISPAAVVVVATFIRAAVYPPPVIHVDREPPSINTAGSRCAPVMALLFDELSFAYLYDGETVRVDYPAIRRFAESATNYRAVTSPGPDTLTALEPPEHCARPRPTGCLPSPGDSDIARRWPGITLRYCALLGELVDRCQSLSFYNASLAHEGFSPANPILTSLIMWPRQFPFGLLKNPPFAHLQRGLVEKTRAFAEQPIDDSRPMFRFIHFSVPHLPFVFTANGFDPPFDPLRTSRYRVQETDRVCRSPRR